MIEMRLGNSEFKNTLENAIKHGYVVLLEDIPT